MLQKAQVQKDLWLYGELCHQKASRRGVVGGELEPPDGPRAQEDAVGLSLEVRRGQELRVITGMQSEIFFYSYC